jgi:hypothetical protein
MIAHRAQPGARGIATILHGRAVGGLRPVSIPQNAPMRGTRNRALRRRAASVSTARDYLSTSYAARGVTR